MGFPVFLSYQYIAILVYQSMAKDDFRSNETYSFKMTGVKSD